MPNILTEKAGPLPLWGWLGIATAGALLFASKGKGSSSNTAAQQAAAQQQLAAEEAALANSAQTATPASNSASSTYGSGGGRYSGNGNTGSAAPVYSATPAASTTAPAAAPAASTAPAQSTAPAPVAQQGLIPFVAPGLQQYTSTGGLSLNQLAAQLGTTPENIISGTSGTDYNKGKAWPYLNNPNEAIPKGIILSYVPGKGNL